MDAGAWSPDWYACATRPEPFCARDTSGLIGSIHSCCARDIADLHPIDPRAPLGGPLWRS
eukprot:2828684-Prymnesium_polylepis.1